MPPITTQVCGNQVCVDPVQVVALAKWIVEVRELQAAINGCSLVVTQ